MTNFSVFEITLLFTLKILNLLFLSNININILSYLRINISQKESLELTTKNTVGNLTAPFKLGTGYKISYLKDRYKFKLTDYIYWNTFFSFFNLFPVAILYIVFGILLGAPLLRDNLIESILLFILIAFTIFLIPKLIPLKLKREEFKVLSKSSLLIQLNYYNYVQYQHRLRGYN